MTQKKGQISKGRRPPLSKRDFFPTNMTQKNDNSLKEDDPPSIKKRLLPYQNYYDMKTSNMKQLMFLVSIRYLLVTKTLSRSSDTTIQPSLDATNAQFPAP